MKVADENGKEYFFCFKHRYTDSSSVKSEERLMTPISTFQK